MPVDVQPTCSAPLARLPPGPAVESHCARAAPRNVWLSCLLHARCCTQHGCRSTGVWCRAPLLAASSHVGRGNRSPLRDGAVPEAGRTTGRRTWRP
jgi:hypothetical protein